MKQPFLTIILSFLICSCSLGQNQTLRPKIKRLTDEIAKENRLDGSSVGIVGKETKQWKRYVRLCKKAQDEELLALTDHANPVVRCYAFKAMVARNNKDVFPALIKHLNDTAMATTIDGCIQMGIETGFFFLMEAMPRSEIEIPSSLNETQKAVVDSLVIFSETCDFAKPYILFDIAPKEIYYQQIRMFVLENKDETAIVALSKYRKREDVALISEKLKKFPSNALWAVRNFPDTAFFPLLLAIHKTEKFDSESLSENRLRLFYQALVQYKNLETLRILESTISDVTAPLAQKKTEYIWLAIKKYPDPLYNHLLNTIRISEKRQKRLLYYLKNDI